MTQEQSNVLSRYKDVLERNDSTLISFPHSLLLKWRDGTKLIFKDEDPEFMMVVAEDGYYVKLFGEEITKRW
mgnify:CR=1 FL=1